MAEKLGMNQASLNRAFEKAEGLGIWPKKVKGEHLSMLH